MADAPSLEAVELVRDFGPIRAVDRVSFALRGGELLTIFGPNGAGKTSLLRVLGGGLRPTEGEVRSGGRALDTSRGAWRRRVGVLSHQGYLHEHLTAQENLLFHGRLFDLDDLDRRVADQLAWVGLSRRKSARVRTLSRGMRQRLALARALLHDPEIILLDEPYTGLDAHAVALLTDTLRSLKDGRRTVVLVTHNLAQGLPLADRVAVQRRGRLEYLEDRAAIDAGGFERLYRDIVEAPR